MNFVVAPDLVTFLLLFKRMYVRAIGLHVRAWRCPHIACICFVSGAGCLRGWCLLTDFGALHMHAGCHTGVNVFLFLSRHLTRARSNVCSHPEHPCACPVLQAAGADQHHQTGVPIFNKARRRRRAHYAHMFALENVSNIS